MVEDTANNAEGSAASFSAAMPAGISESATVTTILDQIAPMPPAKRMRRSASDFIKEQRSRPPAAAAAAAISASSTSACSTALVAYDGAAPLVISRGISMPSILEEVEEYQQFDEDSRNHFEAACNVAASVGSQIWRPSGPSGGPPPPVLKSSEDLTGDLSLKTSLRLSTPHVSFRWLRCLPPALWCPLRAQTDDARAKVREAVLNMCRDCLPALLENPDNAAKWLERVVGCLSWYEIMGPPLPSFRRHVSISGPAEAEVNLAWRRVEQWDEAFRSLVVLLRQGLVSTFVVVADRFSVIVLGEGSGPWISPSGGKPHKPTRDDPCAVLFPSQVIRRVLQENHVPFETARAQEEEGSKQNVKVNGDKASEVAIVDSAIVDTEEMVDLVRDGEKVLMPDNSDGSPLSSALWFHGAWRVHAMLDILRQFSLGAPLTSVSNTPTRLPRLVAPSSFNNATARVADIVKTHSSPIAPTEAETLAGSVPGESHMAELRGCFFPGQVRRFLELLRVLLPKFSCKLATEPRHSSGINVFTQLGLHRVSEVECERVGKSPTDWKWQLTLTD